LYEGKSLIVEEWSGREDLNLRPPGPEPPQGSEENQSKALNRRWIGEQLSPLIGLLIGLQIADACLHRKEQPDESLSCSRKKAGGRGGGIENNDDWNLKDLQEIRENA
jgi:hypothetical protein